MPGLIIKKGFNQFQAMKGHLSLHHANYAKDDAIMQTGNFFGAVTLARKDSVRGATTLSMSVAKPSVVTPCLYSYSCAMKQTF